MAHLIYSAISSLDGYIEGRDGSFDWAMPDEEVHTFINNLERMAGTYLYGRRMYETMMIWETDPNSAADSPIRSARAVTNVCGTVVGENCFYPFGETRFTTGLVQINKLLTEQHAMFTIVKNSRNSENEKESTSLYGYCTGMFSGRLSGGNTSADEPTIPGS